MGVGAGDDHLHNTVGAGTAIGVAMGAPGVAQGGLEPAIMMARGTPLRPAAAYAGNKTGNEAGSISVLRLRQRRPGAPLEATPVRRSRRLAGHVAPASARSLANGFDVEVSDE